MNLKDSLDRKVCHNNPRPRNFDFPFLLLYFYYIIHLAFFKQLVDTYANVATVCATCKFCALSFCSKSCGVGETIVLYIQTKYDRLPDIGISYQFSNKF